MLDKNDLERKLTEVTSKLEAILKNNQSFPDNPEQYDINYVRESVALNKNWVKLQSRVEHLERERGKHNNNAAWQKLNRDIIAAKQVAEAAEKKFYDFNDKNKNLTENVDYKEYIALYEEATKLKAQIAKLNSEPPPKLPVHEVVTPEPPKPPEAPIKQPPALPSWVTSLKDKKEIHLLANILQPINKAWLDNFVQTHKLTMGNIQEDQKIKLVSNDKKNEITVDKKGVHAQLDGKDLDNWIKIIVELYINAVKDTPNIAHKITTADLALQIRIEFTLGKALADQGLFKEGVTVNNKCKRDLVKDQPVSEEGKKAGLGI